MSFDLQQRRHTRIGPYSAVVAAHAHSLGRAVAEPQIETEPRVSAHELKGEAVTDLRTGQFPVSATRASTRSLYRHDFPDRTVSKDDMNSECATNNWLLSEFQNAVEVRERLRVEMAYGPSSFARDGNCCNGDPRGSLLRKSIPHTCTRGDDPRFISACCTHYPKNNNAETIASIYAKQAK
jgi:hypothetical protein